MTVGRSLLFPLLRRVSVFLGCAISWRWVAELDCESLLGLLLTLLRVWVFLDDAVSWEWVAEVDCGSVLGIAGGLVSDFVSVFGETTGAFERDEAFEVLDEMACDFGAEVA